jgi:O-antigen/teichoic acid export membrane protein
MLFIVMAIPPLTYLFFLRRIRPPSGEGAEKTTSNVIRYAWQLTFATLPMELVWYVDKLLISYFFGLNQLATFAVAVLIPEQAKIFLKQFFPISLAKQAQGSDSLERRRKLYRAVLFGTAVFAGGIALYIVCTPVLIPLLFPQYDSAEVMMLTSVMAATLITMPSALISQYLEAQGMIRENRRANWGSAGVFFMLLFWLIPTYGILGAILARGGFRLSLAFLLWFLLLRRPVLFSPKG